MTPDDLRAHIAAEVAARAPVDEREARSIERFLAELERLDAPFLEEADPTHVTASAIVVGPRGVLLHLHKRLGIWIQPGGHIDPGELPWDAAVRETEEETGLAVRHADDRPQLVHVDVHAGGRGHLHLDLRYLLVAGDVDPSPPDGESQQVEWFDWDTAIERCDAGLSGALISLRPADR